MTYSKVERRFLNINLITIISLFLLILAGGVVRSSGSGMGCPDWPKCFDQYIPPTHISQLPANYQEKYVQQRVEKNERFAKLLDKSGYSHLADSLRHDKNIRVPEEFNAAKTYTEYINRLIGALTGIFLLLTFVFSIALFKNKPIVFWLSGINLLLVLIQAWLGSIVVSTNLVAWIITIHMLLAILILAISIYSFFTIKHHYIEEATIYKRLVFLKFAAVFNVIISIVQITLGTEVREAIDAVQNNFGELKREDWLFEVGRIFTQHREMAILSFVVSVSFYILIKKSSSLKLVNLYANWMMIFLVLQIFTGLVLSYFALAPWAQAVHIVLATLLFGAQLYLMFLFCSVKVNLSKG